MKLNLLDLEKSKNKKSGEETSHQDVFRSVDIKFFRKNKGFYSKKNKPLNYTVISVEIKSESFREGPSQ